MILTGTWRWSLFSSTIVYTIWPNNRRRFSFFFSQNHIVFVHFWIERLRAYSHTAPHCPLFRKFMYNSSSLEAPQRRISVSYTIYTALCSYCVIELVLANQIRATKYERWYRAWHRVQFFSFFLSVNTFVCCARSNDRKKCVWNDDRIFILSILSISSCHVRTPGDAVC